MIQNTTEINDIKINRKELLRCRHKSERRWYIFMVALNLLIIVGITGLFISELNSNKAYFDELGNTAYTYMNEDESDFSEVEKKMDESPDSVVAFLSILGILLLLPLTVSYAYAGYRSMSVRITEKNFPEIYAIVKEFAERLGLKKVPNVYLVQGNGILNAFSAFIPFKQYVELYADLVEVAYREHHDMEALRFIIGHEMAHIYLGHATLHYSYSILFSNIIPILASTASRTREYSCDRIAQRLSGSDGINAMMSLTAGIHLYKNVDQDDYIENAKQVKGFFVWCYNLVSSHPVMSKRVQALAMQEGSGKLY